MCIPLIGQTVSIADDQAEIELIGGERIRAHAVLFPDLTVKDHVLVDRGMVIEVIDAAQVESMLAFYADLNNLWDEQDALAELTKPASG